MALVEQASGVPPENCRRLVVLGSTKVGKTSIISRFLTDEFHDSYVPTVEDFHRKIYRIRRQNYRLDIVDTAGHLPNEATRRLTYLTGDMFLIVYRLDQRETFESAKQMFQQILECKEMYGNPSASNPRPTSIILVGNMADQNVNRAVCSSEPSIVVANIPSASFLEASAKERYNTDEVFSLLFLNARLPAEMASPLHRKVTPSYVSRSEAPSSNFSGFVGRVRKVSEACGLVVPFARRPSVATDMNTVHTKQSGQRRSGKRRSIGTLKEETSCAIQ